MPPYNIHELEEKYKYMQKALPEDVNAPVERIMEKFGNVELMSAMRRMREKKLYGNLYFYLNHFLIAEIPFKYGMCPRYEFFEPMTLTYPELKKKIVAGGHDLNEIVIFKRSIYNENLTSFKPAKISPDNKKTQEGLNGKPKTAENK